MAAHKQFLGFAAAAAAVYVGYQREIVVEEGAWTLRVMDGVTPGGFRVSSADEIAAIYAPKANPTFTGTVAADVITANTATAGIVNATTRVVAPSLYAARSQGSVVAANGAAVTLFNIPANDTDGIYNILAYWGTSTGVVGRIAISQFGAVIVDQQFLFSSFAQSGTLSLVDTGGTGIGPWAVKVTQSSGAQQTYSYQYSKT